MVDKAFFKIPFDTKMWFSWWPLSALCLLCTGRLMHLYAVCVDCLEGVHKIICIKCKSRWDGSWHQLGTMYTYDILAASPCCQARLNCKHCGKPVIDVRIGMQYFSEYSNVQQCPHCGNLDYHFVKPFSSFKVLEAYWWKLCFSNSYFIDIITLLHIFYRETFCDINFFSNLKQSYFVCVPLKMGAALCPVLIPKC